MKTTAIKRTRLRPRVKFWLALDDEHIFCMGMCEVLQAIERTGSIKSAAAAVGKSYRHIWARLKRVEQSLGQPLVETHVGGQGVRRSFLTPCARQILRAFRTMRERLMGLADREWSRILQSTTNSIGG